MSSFEDRVGAVVQGILADQMNWPPEMTSAIPQLVAQNPVIAAAQAGDLITSGSRTSSVTTTGTTFAAGADVLSTPLSFTAQGSNNYMVLLVARDVAHSVSGGNPIFSINLDGSDAGVFAFLQTSAAGGHLPCTLGGFLTSPAQGSHTLNVRIWGTTGTVTLTGGAGGAATATPIFIALYRI